MEANRIACTPDGVFKSLPRTRSGVPGSKFNVRRNVVWKRDDWSRIAGASSRKHFHSKVHLCSFRRQRQK